MARIRQIKPEFWTDEKIVELSIPARLLFIGVWNFVDDYGRVEYSPVRLKMQIFPADPTDIRPLLEELEREGMVQVYAVDDKRYLQVRNFNKHQKMDKRGIERLPAPPLPAQSRPNVPLEKEKEKERRPAPNGAGGEPPTASQWIYGKGRELLNLADKPPKDPGALISKWLRDFGEDAVMIAMRIAEAKRSPDPVAFITGVLQNGSKKKTRGVREGVDEDGTELGFGGMRLEER